MKALSINTLIQRVPKRGRAVVTTCLYGLAAGVAAVVFQLGMNVLYRAGLVRLSGQSKPVFVMGSFMIVVGSSLVVGWLLNSF